VRLACALGALNLSGVGEVGCWKKQRMGNVAIGPWRAQVHLLPVSCVVAASHRALNVTNRDEMPDIAFGGLAAFGMPFALWRPPNLAVTSNRPQYWPPWSRGHTEHWPPTALNVCWHVLGHLWCRSSTAAALYSETKMCVCTKIQVIPRAP
jgi:hypothetical protein